MILDRVTRHAPSGVSPDIAEDEMAARISKKIAAKSDQELAERLPFGCHGSAKLPLVEVSSYNVEVREHGRFVGDRANKKAFRDLIEKWRTIAERRGDDPFKNIPAEKLSRKKLEHALLKGESDAAGLVHAAINDFAKRLADVIQRYVELPEWKKTELILIGGGMRGSRLGELAVGRAQSILYERKLAIELRLIAADPDTAGLIGAVFLAPSWIFCGYDGILAVDIGGTNIRAGIVEFQISKKLRIAHPQAIRTSIWDHAEDDPNRDDAIERLLSMLKKLVRWSKKNKLRLAPFVGVGCPGRIRLDGAIDRGAQNLPGNWEADRFNLPMHISDKLTIVSQHRTVVIMHNDAVIQGLSELPNTRGVEHWAILTIGTGLGNAKFATLAARDR